MVKHFTPKKKKGLFAKKSRATLLIDGDVLEYTFVKQRPKRAEEMMGDVQFNGTRGLLSPVDTQVAVFVDLNHLSFAQYYKESNSIMIVGKFDVVYKNTYSDQETMCSYDDEANCFEFEYDFEDLEDFLEVLETKRKEKKCCLSLKPVSL